MPTQKDYPLVKVPSLGDYADLTSRLAYIDGIFERIDAQFAAQKEAVASADRRYQERFEAQQKALQEALLAAKEAVGAALAAAEKAVTKAELAAERRFEALNEIRKALSDQTQNLMPRPESITLFAAMSERVAKLEKSQSEQIGASERGKTVGQQGQWIAGIVIGTVLGAAGLVVGVIGLLKR